MITRGGPVDEDVPWWVWVDAWQWVGWALLALAVLVWAGGTLTMMSSVVQWVVVARRTRTPVRWLAVVWTFVTAPLWPMAVGGAMVEQVHRVIKAGRETP